MKRGWASLFSKQKRCHFTLFCHISREHLHSWLCLDSSRSFADQGSFPPSGPRGEDAANARSRDPLKTPRRWVVERLHSWLNRSRRLLVRWEKRQDTYLAFVQLACALICFQHCLHFLATLVSE